MFSQATTLFLKVCRGRHLKMKLVHWFLTIQRLHANIFISHKNSNAAAALLNNMAPTEIILQSIPTFSLLHVW